MYDTTHVSASKNAKKIFSIFLLFYPKQYRRQFGQEMRLLFYDIYQEELYEKGSVGLFFWLSQCGDMAQSAIEQHVALAKKMGMKKYLQQTLHITKYNVIGFLFLLPFLLVFSIDIIARIAQGDMVHYNRPLYIFLSHTPLYWTPIIFMWVILFPLIAIVINIIPLVKQLSKTKAFNFLFVRNNMITLTLIGLGLGIIAFIKLHDFAPCMIHGLVKVGIGKLPRIVAVCHNA